jgi:DNA-binding NtrC family response regulator
MARPGGDRGDPLAALYRLTDALASAATLDGFASRLAAALRDHSGAADVRIYRRRGGELREWSGPWTSGRDRDADLVLEPDAATRTLDGGETAWLLDPEHRVVVPVGAPAMLVVVLERPERITRAEDLKFASCAGHLAAGLYRSALRLAAAERSPAGAPALIAASPEMIAIRATVDKVGPSDVTVVIGGESGTGKEVIARALHASSSRASGPFVAINCGAIPEGLLEAELFGHEKGAFTGADVARAGHFERAGGGTVLLDEIGEMPLSAQVKLLRVLEDRTVVRVGGSERRPIDVRVIAATNRDLAAAVEAGELRDDLYHRIAVVGIDLPPLRDRPADVVALAEHFVARSDRPITGLSDDAVEALLAHHWPGNVRELRNAIERAVIFAEGERIERADLGPEIGGAAADRDGPPGWFVKLPMRLDELEKRAVFAALRASGGNKSQAARTLGVDRVTVYNKLKTYADDD